VTLVPVPPWKPIDGPTYLYVQLADHIAADHRDAMDHVLARLQ
jgi:hypothetical protein